MNKLAVLTIILVNISVIRVEKVISVLKDTT